MRRTDEQDVSATPDRSWNRGDGEPDPELLETAIAAVRKHCEATRIVLFGSGARGELTNHSDSRPAGGRAGGGLRGAQPALRSRGTALSKSAPQQRGSSDRQPAATAQAVAEPGGPATRRETQRSDPEEAIGPGGERAHP